MMKKHERKVAVMTTKIVFTLLALAVTVLPAAAQNQFLTSFSDRLGPHIFYQIPAAGTNGNDGFHIWQIAPDFGWAGDMNQLPATCDSISPAETCLPLPINLSPLFSYFDTTGKTFFDALQYVNYFGDLELVSIDSGGAISGQDWLKRISTEHTVGTPYGCSPGGACPDGRSLTGFIDDSGTNLYWTDKNGDVVHFNYNRAPWWYEMLSSAGFPNPNSSPGGFVVNSALFALPDTRFSPNDELMFFVDGRGHLLEIAENPGVSNTLLMDLTDSCSPCGDGAPQPMVKSTLTGFTDSEGVHVFYLDILGHVNEFVQTFNAFSEFGGGSSNLNLWNRVVCPPLQVWVGGRLQWMPACTTAASAPAVPDSLTSFTNAFGPQVFYVDVNGHVKQLNLKSNTYQDLTKSFGGEPAAGARPLGNGTCAVGTSLSSIGVDNNGVEWVYYIDDVGHVWEFGSVDSSTWVRADLTGEFGTPNAIVQRRC